MERTVIIPGMPLIMAQAGREAAAKRETLSPDMMSGAAEILRGWAVDMGYDDDTAAFVAGKTIDRFVRTGKVYAECQPVVDAARQFGKDCAAAGYNATFADRNFGAVVAFALIG